jgi:regulator of PEP synthase PpsR (kinase-PPPase family)
MVEVKSMYKIFAVSDATGKTANRVLSAALAQFDRDDVEVIRYGDVRSVERIREIYDEAAREEGFVVHTLVSEELRSNMLDEGRKFNVPTIDLMGPLLIRLSSWFERQPKAQPGLFHVIDEEYDRRIEAVEFTVKHDDGRRTNELNQAEIVLVGVSRTSKTPLSMYLANWGYKVANVPIALGMEPPKNLFKLPKRKVIALTIDPGRLASLREVRAQRLGTRKIGYADLDTVRKEMTYAYELYDKRRDWPLLDMTAKPIEEAAAEIVSIVRRKPA